MPLQEELERYLTFGRRLQNLIVNKQKLTLGTLPGETPDRDKLLAAFWALVVTHFFAYPND